MFTTYFLLLFVFKELSLPPLELYSVLAEDAIKAAVRDIENKKKAAQE